MIKRLNTGQNDFKDAFAQLISVSGTDKARVSEVVKEIIEDVKSSGDAAVEKYSRKFDGSSFAGVKQIVLDDNIICGPIIALFE